MIMMGFGSVGECIAAHPSQSFVCSSKKILFHGGDDGGKYLFEKSAISDRVSFRSDF